MTDTDMEITTRPFMQDLLGSPLAPTSTGSSTAPTLRHPARENSHLLAAVTGTPRTSVQTAPQATTEHPTRAYLRTANPVEPAPEPLSISGYLEVDWNLVETLTKELSVDEGTATRSRGAFDVASAPAGPETPQEEEALHQIDTIIERYSVRLASQRGSDAAWGELTRAHYRQAIFDQAFRYGRLQQYLREPDVEDISVVGCKNVVITKTSGRREKRPDIAENDDALEKMIADIATFRGRTFARPGGYLDLDIGGARLSATGEGITSVTNLTVRKHNLVGIDLDDMVQSKTISKEIGTFLAAAGKANLCAVIAGFPGTGKTTMLRALVSTVRPEEKIVTIETERELYLNKLPERHWQVQDLQYVPPQFAGGDSEGGFSLAKCLEISLRSSAERILFAEIRGPEGPIAIKAMQAGKGSLSTIHARSADDAIHRFADILMSEQGLSDDTVPLRQIMRSIDLILYIDFIHNTDGTRRRVVTEVAEVTNNDMGTPFAATLFEYDRELDEYTKPNTKLSTELSEALARVGYDHHREQGIR